jgi:hypothetical protein
MVPGQDGPHIEEDTMHPILTQALVAERAREWEKNAARYRLAKRWRRARHEAARAGAELPGPRGGSRQPAPRAVVPAAAAPVAEVDRDLVAVAGGKQAAGGGRQTSGGRAA